MIPDSTLPTLRAACRTLQIIVFALAMGVCVFAVIATMQRQGKFEWAIPPPQTLDSVLLLMGTMALVGSFVVPALLPVPTQEAPRPTHQSEPDSSLAMLAAGAVQTRTIVGCAMLEGGAFANLMAVFTHGYGPSLVLAAVLLSMIVLRFPTWNRYLERIEATVRRMREGNLK